MRQDHEEIAKKLRGLREVQPEAEYVRNSRRLILSSKSASISPKPGILAEITKSLGFAFETALVAALFLVVILGGVFGLSKSLFLPPLQGIDEKALLTEASTLNADINLRLNDIAYFGNHKTSTERVVALDTQRIQWQREKLPLAETATDEEIDKLLNRVINQY